MRRFLFIGLVIALLAPALALVWVKPLRVLIPKLGSSVRCFEHDLCADDESRAGEARQLYLKAVAKVSAKVGSFHSRPRIIFCSSDACRKHFGLGARAALAVGDYGIAVAPRGWKEFYLTHELIHYRQAEEFGNLAMLRKPSWLIEGMAYSLSEDPRRPLTDPFEGWRARFEAWNAVSHGAGFWGDVGRAE